MKLGFEPYIYKQIGLKYKNQPITAEVGGKTYTFRSRTLEYPIAKYLQLLKETGYIKDWLFENTTFKSEDGFFKYLVDFDVLENDGSFYYIEAKGYMNRSEVRRKIKWLHIHRPEVRLMMVFQDKKQMARLGPKASSYCWRVCLLSELTKGIL